VQKIGAGDGGRANNGYKGW